MKRAATLLAALLSLACGCERRAEQDDYSLAKRMGTFRVGQREPALAEAEAVGSFSGRIRRGSPAFKRLVVAELDNVIFKDEERDRSDRRMTPRLRERLDRLAGLVQRTWPGLSLRVTEAWDENGEHGRESVHYEGRAADITTSDVDPKKLGKLATLAVEAGFDWVFYEDATHVHVSVKR